MSGCFKFPVLDSWNLSPVLLSFDKSSLLSSNDEPPYLSKSVNKSFAVISSVSSPFLGLPTIASFIIPAPYFILSTTKSVTPNPNIPPFFSLSSSYPNYLLSALVDNSSLSSFF